MDFSITRFSKPVITETAPDWIKSSATLRLYKEIVAQHDSILGNINKGNPLTVKGRRLIPKKIAENCGLSPSIISIRRQPEICILIKELNEELELAFKSTKANQNTSGRKQTKKEIEENYKAQKDEITRITNLKLAEAMTAAINNLSIQSSKNQAATIVKLKVKIIELENIIERQAIQLQTTFKIIK